MYIPLLRQNSDLNSFGIFDIAITGWGDGLGLHFVFGNGAGGGMSVTNNLLLEQYKIFEGDVN